VSGRTRLRRRLLLGSVVPALLVLLVAVKMLSVVVAGGAAVDHFAAGDRDGLRGDVSTLQVADVLEPAKTLLAAGDLAVLDGRVDDAADLFARALAQDGGSCPVRVNLELVRETQGDRAAASGEFAAAETAYRGALTVVNEARAGCFAGNDDPDPARRAVRAEAAERLAAKLAALPAALPPAPAPPPPVAAAPPPPVAAPPDEQPPDAEPIPLAPGDPLQRLQQILQDSQRAAG
jgi:hypothetical protein